MTENTSWKFCQRILLHWFVSDWLPYCSAYSGRDKMFTCLVQVLPYRGQFEAKCSIGNKKPSYIVWGRLNVLSRINFHMIIVTVDDTKCLVAHCEHNHMEGKELNRRQTFQAKRFVSDWAFCLELTLMWLSLQGTRRRLTFFTLSAIMWKSIRSKKIQSETKKFKSDLLPPTDFPLLWSDFQMVIITGD